MGLNIWEIMLKWMERTQIANLGNLVATEYLTSFRQVSPVYCNCHHSLLLHTPIVQFLFLTLGASGLRPPSLPVRPGLTPMGLQSHAPHLSVGWQHPWLSR